MDKEDCRLVFPQELDVWYVLPALRKEFAIEMIKQGLSQKDIAKLIGLTEASISHYKKEKRANELTFNQEIKELIKRSVKQIMDKKSTVFNEIIKIDDVLKERGIFCQIHRSKCKNIGECLECRKRIIRR